MMAPDFHHLPVLPEETVSTLSIRPGGIYADGTLGGGGHAELILERLTEGTLLGIDRDTEAIKAATTRLEKVINPGTKFIAVHGNFYDLPEIMQEQGIGKADGVLLDLGVSSHQLDTAERGFSYRFDGPLDMRMNRQQRGATACEIVNTYSQGELMRILYRYGEERHARLIAGAICKAREKNPIKTTRELVNIIEASLPGKAKHGGSHPAMRTFMALRIEVNDELAPLEAALTKILRCLNPGGRIAVITFHSLEDRIVKHTFKKLANPCECPRDIPYCACGRVPQVRIITRSPIVPGAEETARNSRATSAKLRVAEKIL
jgi:16S rRNA (cytosine1402-N4)-methyltransferase